MRAFPVNGGPHGQRGQSLVEMAIACIVLVPLAIGIVYIGQYIHLRQTTQMAAREAAWDAAVSPTVYKVAAPDVAGEQNRLRSRYFADPNAAIRSAAPVPGSFADTMLPDYAGHSLLTPDQLTISVYQNDKTPGVEGQIDSLLGKVTGELSNLGLSPAGEFPPDPKGYITAQVDAKAARATRFDPLDGMDLDFHSRTVLLADAWDADGAGEDAEGESSTKNLLVPKRSVREAVTYLAPATAIFGGKLGGLVHTVGEVVDKIPILDDFFPSTDEFAPGKTAPDVVPADKLATYKKP
jgi:hypothetical protein